MKNCFFLVLISFFFFHANGQEDDDPVFYVLIKPKHSYTIDFGLPVTVANRAFKGVMQGFMRGSASYQYTLKNGFGFGLGGNYTYFQINRFKISPQLLGGMHLINGFTKLGYERYSTERFGYEGGVKIGYSRWLLHSDSIVGFNKEESTAVEPYFSFAITASEKTAYKWTISYAFLGRSFRPDDIGDNVNEDYKQSEYNRITRFLTFGFSFTHYFGKW